MRHEAGATTSKDGDLAAEDPFAKEYQRLWFALARSAWASLVLVPAHPGGSADGIARSLAEVGKRLSDVPVTAVTAGSLEYATAVALADLPQFVDRRRLLPEGRWPTVDGEAVPAPVVTEEDVGASTPAAPDEAGLMVSSAARLIISIPSVVSEPLGLATTQRADVIVLCIHMGQARMADARRSLELIGRERIAGCFLVR